MNDNQRAAIHIVHFALRGRGRKAEGLDTDFLANNPWSTTENLLAEFALGLWMGDRRPVHLRFAAEMLDERQWRILTEALAIARGPATRPDQRQADRCTLFTPDERYALWWALSNSSSVRNELTDRLTAELKRSIPHDFGREEV